MEYKRFDSSEGNVFKYVFTTQDAVAESVLYKYWDFYKRTVICCSVQSGCPVGCKFCGTGAHFIRNLTDKEIVEQIETVLKDMGIEDVDTKSERFQIMFMSMGEPLLNYRNVDAAIRKLHEKYPNAELLLSTIGPDAETRECEDTWWQLFRTSREIDKVGLQFSVHQPTDERRNRLIPYSEKLPLRGIRDMGMYWWMKTGRHPYLNYCITGTNNSTEDAQLLMNMFSPLIFKFTFSVVCNSDETMKEAGYRNLAAIREFEELFLNEGYNTRIFDPAGQDDIGGGCGQLWYVQRWLKEHVREEN